MNPKDIDEVNDTCAFSLDCILREDKFNSFDTIDKESIVNHPDVEIDEIKIKNPDNPAQLINAKLIKLEV